MSFTLRDIKMAVDLPSWPRSMPVFKVKSVAFQERQRAIEVFREILEFHEPLTIEAQDSVHLVTERGEIQFYRPSGALWVHDSQADSGYEDERRPWKVIETKNPDDPEGVMLTLEEPERRRLAEQTEMLLRSAGLLADQAYLAGVDLDQVARLDEDGQEVERFAGEANVRFLYRLNDLRVDGPGAKTYAFYNPGERAHQMTGLYHAWREVEGAVEVQMRGPEETLERALVKDPELVLYTEKQESQIALRQLELVYLTLPPVKFQEWVFPALHVVGSVVPREAPNEGFEFARFYTAGSFESYVKAGIVAGYMITRA